MKNNKSSSIFLNPKLINISKPVFTDTIEKMRGKETVAYFSMEYGLKDALPLYSGGLGVLAGDSLKSSSDLHVPMISIGILWKEGYFTQKIINGEQEYAPQVWDPNNVENLHLTDKEVSVDIQDVHKNIVTIKLKVWRYDVISADGKHIVPLFLLDADHPDNNTFPWTKDFTRQLYDSKDNIFKIVQRYILGVGGMRLLDQLEKEYDLKLKYHLNEGHAAMAIVEYHNLYEADLQRIEDMQNRFTFTIHTPVDAALDRMNINDLYHILPPVFVSKTVDFGYSPHKQDSGVVNMPYLAMKHSRLVNGVAELHGIITKIMFPDFIAKISHITNGVYTGPEGWLAPEIRDLLRNFMIGNKWENDPEIWAIAKGYLKGHEQFRLALHQTHLQLKNNFIDYLNENSDGVNIYPLNGPEFQKDWLTIGFARRFAKYKRANLLFHNMKDLTKFLHETHDLYNGRGIQFVFSGKSHPQDNVGKGIIKDLTHTIDKVNSELGEFIRLKFIVNYNMEKALKMVSSVDFWQNNPMSPMEASGTSGMKAALNGVPQISTPDGWWPETVHNAGITFGTYVPNRSEADIDNSYAEDSRLLLRAQRTARDIFYADLTELLNMRINAMFGNGAFFNTHRQDKQYLKMWGIKPLKL